MVQILHLRTFAFVTLAHISANNTKHTENLNILLEK